MQTSKKIIIIGALISTITGVLTTYADTVNINISMPNGIQNIVITDGKQTIASTYPNGTTKQTSTTVTPNDKPAHDEVTTASIDCMDLAVNHYGVDFSGLKAGDKVIVSEIEQINQGYVNGNSSQPIAQPMTVATCNKNGGSTSVSMNIIYDGSNCKIITPDSQNNICNTYYPVTTSAK